MKIQVTSCTDNLFWYCKYLGMIFDVVKTDPDGTYWVREPNQFRAKNFILKQDATEVSSDD